MADEVSWKDALPPELKELPALKDFKDPAALAKSFVDTKSALGNSIRIPGPDASPEARAEFRQKLADKVPELLEFPEDETKFAEVEGRVWEKLGRPKDAKQYEPPKLEVEFTPEETELLRSIAMKRGYTKKQFAQLAKDAAEEKTAIMKRQADAQGALKKELGFAYEDKLSLYAHTAEATGAPPELVKAIKAGTIDLATAKWLDGVSKSLGGEGRAVGDQGSGGAPKLTPDEAKLQIAEVMARKEYFTPGGNRDLHEQLKAKVARLMVYAYPEEARHG